MKVFIPFLSMMLIAFQCAFTQVSTKIVFVHEEAKTILLGVQIQEKLLLRSDGSIGFALKSDIDFQTYAIGWKASTNYYSAGEFEVKTRIHHTREGWSEWTTTEGYVHPDDHIRTLYFTELQFGNTLELHDSIEFYIYAPYGVEISEVHLVYQDMSKTTSQEGIIMEAKSISGTNSCPPFPAIIPRADWCGGYTACHNPTYTPTTLTAPTHIVVHHGASPNTYTDGYAVVRSYWNYHVNSNGWSDIGYNYLFDKYGNFFQGRHNLNLPNVDVRGAHAGSSNAYSIGVNFLGNADVTLPTTAQIQKLNEFMAWWFNHRSFDPTTQALLLNQAGTQWLNLHRVCGHIDVHATACPGTTLYGLLPSFRTTTKQIIQDCTGGGDTTAPVTHIDVNRKWQSTDFEVVFTDEDNQGGSGVKHSFYQVMDFNGTEWRANAQEGFFNDNFQTAIHPEWTALSGTWSINSNNLLQSDESVTNPNIYALVNQTAANIYMYHYQMRISGTGTNRRAGIFFFCSDPSALYRGDAYMVYFRVETNNVEVYKATGTTISGILHQATTPIDANVWFDVKITYNPANGDMNVYKDNKHVLFWKDTSPLTSGNGISFRTGGCQVRYDDMKVYKSRNSSAFVTVGNNATKHVRYESPSASQDACRIRTQIVDNSNNWSLSKSENIFIDWTAPITSSSVAGTWQTADFIANFTDNDALSGIEKRFYQVLDFNGTRWSANSQQGFFCDVMNVANPDWTVYSGNWTFNGTELVQSNETLNNTNIYAYLKQDLSNRYLYEFNMKIDGSGGNRRAGFHYFCDTPDTLNRGNSYFIWFRIATQKLEFYKVVNDTFNLEKIFPVTFNASQWYNVKVVFDRVTGDHFVYLDNKLVGEWKDPSPFPLAGHGAHSWISFRSGNCQLSVNQLKVYRTRLAQATVTIGDNTKMIRYQNPDPLTYAAKIKSIVSDSAQNISTIYYHDLNIDWTAPTAVGYVNDGPGSDIDTSIITNQLEANWDMASDPHSGIASYSYSIGTSPGAIDVLPWTIGGASTSMLHGGLSLIVGQTYYISIRAENGASLTGNPLSSDGVVIVSTTSAEDTEMGQAFSVYPIPADDFVTIHTSLVHVEKVRLYNYNGQLISEHPCSGNNQTISLSGLPGGVYFIVLFDKNKEIHKAVIVKN